MKEIISFLPRHIVEEVVPLSKKAAWDRPSKVYSDEAERKVHQASEQLATDIAECDGHRLFLGNYKEYIKFVKIKNKTHSDGGRDFQDYRVDIKAVMISSNEKANLRLFVLKAEIKEDHAYMLSFVIRHTLNENYTKVMHVGWADFNLLKTRIGKNKNNRDCYVLYRSELKPMCEFNIIDWKL